MTTYGTCPCGSGVPADSSGRCDRCRNQAIGNGIITTGYLYTHPFHSWTVSKAANGYIVTKGVATYVYETKTAVLEDLESWL